MAEKRPTNRITDQKPVLRDVSYKEQQRQRQERRAELEEWGERLRERFIPPHVDATVQQNGRRPMRPIAVVRTTWRLFHYLRFEAGPDTKAGCLLLEMADLINNECGYAADEAWGCPLADFDFFVLNRTDRLIRELAEPLRKRYLTGPMLKPV